MNEFREFLRNLVGDVRGNIARELDARRKRRGTDRGALRTSWVVPGRRQRGEEFYGSPAGNTVADDQPESGNRDRSWLSDAVARFLPGRVAGTLRNVFRPRRPREGVSQVWPPEPQRRGIMPWFQGGVVHPSRVRVRRPLDDSRVKWLPGPVQRIVPWFRGGPIHPSRVRVRDTSRGRDTGTQFGPPRPMGGGPQGALSQSFLVGQHIANTILSGLQSQSRQAQLPQRPRSLAQAPPSLRGATARTILGTITGGGGYRGMGGGRLGSFAHSLTRMGGAARAVGRVLGPLGIALNVITGVLKTATKAIVAFGAGMLAIAYAPRGIHLWTEALLGSRRHLTRFGGQYAVGAAISRMNTMVRDFQTAQATQASAGRLYGAVERFRNVTHPYETAGVRMTNELLASILNFMTGAVRVGERVSEIAADIAALGTVGELFRRWLKREEENPDPGKDPFMAEFIRQFGVDAFNRGRPGPFIGDEVED